MSWAGWQFAAAASILRGKHRFWSVLLFVVTLALSIYAGNPQIEVLILLPMAVFAVVVLLWRNLVLRVGEAGPPTDHRSGPCVGRRSRPLRSPCPSWPPTGKRLHQEFRDRTASLFQPRRSLESSSRASGGSHWLVVSPTVRGSLGDMGLRRGHRGAGTVSGGGCLPLAPSRSSRTRRRHSGRTCRHHCRAGQRPSEQAPFYRTHPVEPIAHTLGVLPVDARWCGSGRGHLKIGTAEGRPLGHRRLSRDRSGPRSGVVVRTGRPPPTYATCCCRGELRLAGCFNSDRAGCTRITAGIGPFRNARTDQGLPLAPDRAFRRDHCRCRVAPALCAGPASDRIPPTCRTTPFCGW